MGYIDNILQQVQLMPTYKPATASTFGDWSIDVGDIITLHEANEEAGPSGIALPVMNSTMNWNGSSQTTIESTGNEKREVQDRYDRDGYNYESGIASTLKSYGRRISNQEELTEDYKELVAQVDEATAGVTALVKKDKNGNYYATSTLGAYISDGAKAELKTTALYDAQTKTFRSFAQLQADVIDLIGDVNASGNFNLGRDLYTSSGDLLIGQTGNMYANNLTVSGTLTVGDYEYEKRKITTLSSFTQALSGGYGHQASTTSIELLVTGNVTTKFYQPDYGAQIYF